MFTRGTYIDRVSDKISTLFISHENKSMETFLCDGFNVQSAYYTNGLTNKCYNNKTAQNVSRIISQALSKCNTKNAQLVPFKLGTATMHQFQTKKVQYQLLRYNGLLAGCSIISDEYEIEIEYCDDMKQSLFDSMRSQFNYVELKSQKLKVSDDDEEIEVSTRSLEEIALEKDITWLKNKQYYVVNDDAVAEQIFTILDNCDCVVAYDTETTGLHINMFSKVNSKYAKQLEEYNKNKPKADRIRADRLTGIIFCVEDNVSYYFPVGNRKFKNLYETDTDIRTKLVNKYKAEYTIGGKNSLTGDIARYWRETPEDKITPDVILMERCRNILTTKHIVAHNGSFEWKVSYCYDIDINLCDDTMIMHQLMYKFRSTTSNKGEPSNLKYLTKRELGIDQLDLKDFFTEYKEDKDGLVRGKKKSLAIDFSYMDFEGSRAYAPADGDTTLQIYKRYKKDLVENHRELVYLYQIEIIVACAIAYMEFYGIKLDEEHINDVCESKKTELLELELDFRKSVNYSSDKEIEMRSRLDLLKDELADIVSSENNVADDVRVLNYKFIIEPNNKIVENKLTSKREELKAINDSKHKKQREIDDYRKSIYDTINSSEKTINLGSPAQVSALFFDELGIECSEEKRSVSKKVLKSLKKLKNENDELKYPMVSLYSQWKDTSTLITKFFDKLPQFMFPGGFIFPSFGQISTATGRMSCIEGNTPISLSGGQKCIKDVRPGDRVYCYDSQGKIHIREVLNVIDQGEKECIELKWKRKDTSEVCSLICTPDHKIMTSYGDWAEAGSLQKGDEVPHSKIIGSKPVGIHHVYDLEIKEYHNFVANGLIVHNCSKPNAQQFCKAVTSLVVPRENNIMLDADFSQIEYRTLVAMANEPKLIEQFKDPDSDYHTIMASLMFGVPYASVNKQMRSEAKSFNFGIPYGMGFKSLAILLSGMSDKKHIDEAKEKYELYFKDQPNVKAFFDRVKESALMYKYTKTLWGRRRYYSFTNPDGTISNERKAYAQRQAGNAIIQGTAADIFKISVARNFAFIRKEGLLGKLLIINMVHDEQLFEVDCNTLNPLVVYKHIADNMQFKIDGFPPLFIGAGFGFNWKYAKGEQAEIHPTLCDQLCKEAEGKELFLDKPISAMDAFEYFQKKVNEFRFTKVKNYLLDKKNWGNKLHPVIGSLLRGNFSYGLEQDEEMSDDAYLQLILKEFISRNNLEVSPEYFTASETDTRDDEEDKEYFDEDEEADDDYEIDDSEFVLIDEDNKMFGASIIDLIREFGYFVSPQKKVCGISTQGLSKKKLSSLSEYLASKVVEPGTDQSMELCFLKDGNILHRTGVYVANIDAVQVKGAIA